MNKDHRCYGWLLIGIVLLLAAIFAAGCASGSDAEPVPNEAGMLMLPELEAANLEEGALQVVATTNIVGDVVSQVGGDAIALTTLMDAGEDPHAYQPAAQDLVPVAGADVIFINGWDLEETLLQDLEEIGKGVPMVAISANIDPLIFGQDEDEDGEEEHDHQHGADPHTWFAIQNVKQWVENTESVLSMLDPDNAGTYQGNAAAYLVELEELESYVEAELTQIKEEDRVLVSNHDSLGYFAEAYEFTVLDTVVPAASTLAEPSASDLAGLIEQMREHGVCIIVTETTASGSLAQTVADELDGCEGVDIVQLYTGSIGPVGSGADSYTGMFRANVDAIVEAMR